MIYLVGSGPGDPELLTIKAVKLLQQADCVLYAGSTCSSKVLDYCPEHCIKKDSASLTLEEIIRLLSKWEGLHKTIVRLHSGDPAIYGAVNEEIEALGKLGIVCKMVPGISAYSALASTVKWELTLPNVTQSVLITRFEGRTPVPENLDALLSQQLSVAIYLSGSMGPAVLAKLKQYYPHDAALTVGHQISRPEQRIETKPLSEWKTIDFPSNLTLFLIRKKADGPSKLYDKSFSHQYRKENHENGVD
ncbi:MAG: cobalt-precorrin-4/precorrin-4 C(11)-methyltransferase [Thermotogota bacterium]|nr:cobalt-precorrin-4/precorrin-4 C(11)-methyltransferase [Thermotogota bacterium]